jgi:hypothetical protein
MGKVVVSAGEWAWLLRLNFTPRRVACSIEEVGEIVVVACIEKGLVEKSNGCYRVTSLVADVMKAPPPPMSTGERVWMVP